MHTRRHALIATALLSLALGACSAGDDDITPDGTTETLEAEDTNGQATSDDGNDEDATDTDMQTDMQTGTVDIIDNDYEPGQVEVNAGGTVEWTNTGQLPHTVTFDDEDSGNLAPDAVYTRTFDEPGEFDYRCTIHPGMEATITVTD